MTVKYELLREIKVNIMDKDLKNCTLGIITGNLVMLEQRFIHRENRAVGKNLSVDNIFQKSQTARLRQAQVHTDRDKKFYVVHQQQWEDGYGHSLQSKSRMFWLELCSLLVTCLMGLWLFEGRRFIAAVCNSWPRSRRSR